LHEFMDIGIRPNNQNRIAIDPDLDRELPDRIARVQNETKKSSLAGTIKRRSQSPNRRGRRCFCSFASTLHGAVIHRSSAPIMSSTEETGSIGKSFFFALMRPPLDQSK